MKVKLKTGFWQTEVYDISVDARQFTLKSETKEKVICIPLSELLQISLPGSEHFCLETADAIYEGRFTAPGDAKTLIDRMCALGYRIEVNLVADRDSVFFQTHKTAE